ncbi:response regulator [Azoarcus indigens]|uniref:Chemotaxis protein CheA n=1 Tax=Azoarcus indigens TaxID=29545 RepID=A0A4R6E6J2_9RHOO|nr:Hpt domain-containing protein [Azoarcus indigens]NMG67555.1 response regulator [Azoarcus indigens]TDN53546.1 chemosensory pili system protein ChpA (sensor histidine kinase/response regulator) [Azoarcus indigens]
MTQAIEADLGPLTWVKSEIDLALARAAEALEQACSAGDGASQVQFAQTHLHQVRGALSIVGLDGLTQFAAALDQLMGKLARGEMPVDDAPLALVHRALASIGNYLEEIARGAPDQPMRLAPLYQEINAARGDTGSPVELFFPDLGIRPPRRADDPRPPEGAALQAALRTLRARFERGLLDLLRRPGQSTGPAAMRAAAADIEALQPHPLARSLWWSAQAFFDALATGDVDMDAARRLCAQLDAQLRRQLGGNPAAPERLLRELLYLVAQAPATTEQQRAVRATWQLDTLLPPASARVSEVPLAPLLQSLRTRLNTAKECWTEFSEGSAAALPRFDAELTELAGAVAQLGRPALDRLLTGLQGFIQWLRKDPLRFSETVGLEVATALLLAEAAVDRGIVENDLAQQVDATLVRLRALEQGDDLQAAGPAPGLAAARRAQEKEALAQLSREILTSLAHIEQALDDFFRNQEKRAPLAQLSAPMQQIEGALILLGETEAIALVHQSAEEIAHFAAGGSGEPAEFEALAHRLSALGFYIQSLQHGRNTLQDFLDPEARKAAQDSEEISYAEPVTGIPSGPTPAPAPAAGPAPGSTAATEPEAEEAVALELAPLELADFDLPVQEPVAVPAPAAETQKLIEASDAEIDAELLCIFIEEAHDVLATIAEQLELSRTSPADSQTLTAIRRGFHTLKGSGRMVGLRELGEAAWGLEQTLNRWLQLEWQPSPALHHLIDAAHQYFAAWVAQMEAGAGQSSPDPEAEAALLAEAERLRATDTPAQEPAVFTAPAPESRDGLMETSLEFPDLSLSDDGEILPVEAEIPATPQPLAVPPLVDEGFHSEETSLELDSSYLLDDRDALPGLEPAGDRASGGTPAAETQPPQAPPLALDDLDIDLELEDDALPPLPEAGDDGELVTEEAPPPAAEAPAAAPESGADFVRLGDTEISRPLYDLFLGEARHHIATLHQEFTRLAANPTLLPQEPSVRAAHTLAGISGTARLTALHTLGRALEHAQQRLRDLSQPPTADETALFTTVTDTLEAMLAEVAQQQLPLEVPELVDQLDRSARPLIEELPAPQPLDDAPLPAPAAAGLAETLASSPVSAAEPEPVDEEAPSPVHDDIDEQLLPIFLEEGVELVGELHARLRSWEDEPAQAAHPQAVARLLHTLKGSARMAGAMTLGERLHQMESRFEAGQKSGRAPAAQIEDLATGLDFVQQTMDALASGEAVPSPADAQPAKAAEAAATTAAPAAEAALAGDPGDGKDAAADIENIASPTLRVRADLVDRFVNEAGEIGIARTRIEGELRTLRRSLLDLTENVIRLRNQLREVEIQADVQMQSRIAQAESAHGEFDPLEMDRYTRLQELTRMMAESVNDVTTVQQNLLKNLDGADIALHGQARLSRELQQALMGVRMVPFDSLADRLYRVVRQAAKDLGKRANLDLRGGRIEVDRGVLEHMVAPLEHLLRNALAHGIEAPAQREAGGKPAIGQITLSVSQEGNEIALELSDDGAGLDFGRIAERARANGLLGTDEHADERRLTNLIFVPGFTTAGAVSTVAGRGVGMDVVKAETAAVGGRIDVHSDAGKGTVFRIYLPLTLAVTQALLVRAGGRSYAIPSSMVAQVMELKADALEKLRNDKGTEWMGERYAYRYLPRLLGDRQTRPEVQRYNWVLLLRAGAQTLALHVDALRGNQEIVVKNAGPQLARIVGMSGATVLGDGEIVLILNPVALASRSLAEADEDGGEDGMLPAVAAQPSQPTVMVVDDSLTVRKITGRLLEREGYRVVTAKDGVDALEKLIETVPDVILSDIEMPRMDGFDLVRNIRADARTRLVPVIMITSRLADKHRRYAEEVGANHYLGKPYQEEELLGLLAGYTARTPA